MAKAKRTSKKTKKEPIELIFFKTYAKVALVVLVSLLALVPLVLLLEALKLTIYDDHGNVDQLSMALLALLTIMLGIIFWKLIDKLFKKL